MKNPSKFIGTTKYDVPLCFSYLLVVTKTIANLDSCEFIIQNFVPFIVHSYPSWLNLDVVDAASISFPFPGSDRPNHPKFIPPSSLIHVTKGVIHRSYC